MKWCKELDIKIKVFFTFGHIGQTYEECLTDVDYIKRHKKEIDFYATTIGLRVYPGTNLERQAKDRGYMSKNFSWAKYKPSISNILLFEPADVYILKQPSLGVIALNKIILKLLKQGTILSFSYIIKMVFENINIIFSILRRELRYTKNRIVRAFS